MSAGVLKMNRDRERLAALSDKYYADGKYLDALRFTCREMELYGGSYEAYIRMSDIYENLALNAYAIKWLFMEQDCAYWNYSGRQMLFSGLNERGLI